MISRSLWLFHDSSLFTSPVTSIHAEARDDRHCEKENLHGGVLERKGAHFFNSSETEKFFVLSGV